MTLLQLNPYPFQATFLQYGVLGIVAFVLGYFAWTSYKNLVRKNDALEKKVDDLQLEVRALLVEERDRMSKIIEDNTKAITELRQIIVTALLSPNEQ